MALREHKQTAQGRKYGSFETNVSTEDESLHGAGSAALNSAFQFQPLHQVMEFRELRAKVGPPHAQ